MAYNPYAAMADADSAQTNRLHQPQPQRSFAPQQPQQPPQQQPQAHQLQQGQFQQPAQGQFGQFPQGQFQQHQQSQPQGFNANYLNNLMADPTANIGLQAGQQFMNAGQQFMQAEFQKIVPTGTIKAYFKVSNYYVLSKLLLILFPWRNTTWGRKPAPQGTGSTPTQTGEQWAFPLDDTNAPDFYIPLMGIVTYILLTAMVAGLQGEFHPEVFGFETSSTLAYLILDFGILKGGLYMLNLTSSSYDLIAYTGYKFVPITLILFLKNISSWTSLNWVIYFYLLAAYGFFELRSIRFNLFGGVANSTHTMSSKTKKTNYFLFVYAFLIQGALLWLLS